MNTTANRTAYWQRVAQLALFATLVVFITFLFPSRLKIDFVVQPGQTWRFEDLRAPFDFPVLKPDSVLKAERETALRDFSPVYRLNTELLGKKLELLESQMRNQLAQSGSSDYFPDVAQRPEVYFKYAQRILTLFYDRGILQPAAAHADRGDSFVITVLKDNTARRRTLENFFSVKTAQEWLIDSLPASGLREPDFLYPLLESLIEPNLQYDEALSNRARQELLESVSEYGDMVKKGDLIALRNGLVSEEAFQKITSMRAHYTREFANRQSEAGIGSGYFLLAFILALVFFIYLKNLEPVVLQRTSHLAFVLSWIAFYSWIVYMVERTNPFNAYFIPFCIAPIIIQTFFNKRLALFTHITTILYASFISSLGWDFTFLQILAGIVVLLVNADISRWSRFFLAILSMLGISLLTYLGLTLVGQGKLGAINLTIPGWLLLAAFLTLLALPMIPMLERLFGFVSPLRLRELADLNRPLLQELAFKAPGTFQHSIQLSNLCEAAALEIGADALLVKTGALYHDIGKMVNPEYFVENQLEPESPHRHLTPEESAKIILGHVSSGVQIAKKYGLPTVLVDFITTHHGTTRTEFFYRKMMLDNPNMPLTDAAFRYQGPLPGTKEQTIMMLGDSIEAASRSLQQPTEQAIMVLIDQVIQDKITMGQMNRSPLTFKELEVCRHTFRRILRSVHHPRIAYPELKSDH